MTVFLTPSGSALPGHVGNSITQFPQIAIRHQVRISPNAGVPGKTASTTAPVTLAWLMAEASSAGHMVPAVTIGRDAPLGTAARFAEGAPHQTVASR